MRRIHYAALVALLGFALLLAPGCTVGSPAETAQEPTTRTVHVSGQGRVSVEPDLASIELGVQTEAETAQAALAQNNQLMGAALDAIKAAGVAAEDIQTQSIRLAARYEDVRSSGEARSGTGTRTLVGYTASNLVQVQVHDLARLGEILDAAVQAGGNQVRGIRFEVQDPSAALDRAREAAWTDAKHKAEQLAELSGQVLRNATLIQESSTAPGPIVREAVEAEAARAVPIESGMHEIEVGLTVEWNLW